VLKQFFKNSLEIVYILVFLPLWECKKPAMRTLGNKPPDIVRRNTVIGHDHNIPVNIEPLAYAA
jgi:hypothetical protein